METTQKQKYLKLNTQMFVRMCRVWFGSVEIMFMPFGEIQETQFLGEDDCHPKLYSSANNGSCLTCCDH